MPPSSSPDEFSALPDIVDFAAVPLELCGQALPNHSNQFDEFDALNEIDPFSGIDLDAIPGLAPIQFVPLCLSSNIC